MRKIGIAGLALIACVSLAEAPQRADSAKSPSAEKRQSQQKTNTSHYPTKDSPLPIEVIQSNIDSAHGAAREDKADKYADDSLSAAKDQAAAGIWQAAVGLFGIILLGFTYWETRKTARSAQDASRAAIDQVDAMKAAERPHLVVKKINIDLSFKNEEVLYPHLVKEPRSIPISYETGNVGKSPAWVIRYGYSGFIGKELPAIPEWEDGGTWYEAIVPTDEVGAFAYVRDGKEAIFLTIEKWMEVKKAQEGGDKRLFFYGFVQYRDLHGDVHMTSGAWRYQRLPFADPEEFFQPCGPAAYWQHT